MLFLRSLYAHGFKSFAEPTRLDFTSEMIGIVGPNGSGKSNITDAIRWALGEQSNKSLRGKSMDDIVFSGSANKTALNNAKVSLTFSNERNTFGSLDSDLVEITRTFDKKKRESEFFINGEKVKLRDVQELALETGLTKSSLAIISQGTITNFASARPEDRRELFNEAAGVAKYKKRKLEALNKLIHAQENLNRFNDLINEISKRLPGLERAAKKAKIYQEKFKELSEIEITVIRKDLIVFNARVEEINALLSDNNQQILDLAKEINGSDDEFKNLAFQLNDYEHQYSELQNQITQLNERIVNLRVKKSEADSREKAKDANANDDALQANRLKKEYQEIKIRLEAENSRGQQIEQDLSKEREQYDLYTNNFNDALRKIEQIRKTINQLEAKINWSENQGSNNRSAQDQVVQNKNRIGGVIGKLVDLVEVEPQYQEAISVVAGGTMFSVVMESSQATKKALEFLDTNRLGRATFLPLDVLSPTTITGINRNVIEQAPGFLGFANEIVQIKQVYQKALDYALGGVVVIDDYDNALTLGRQINYRYNIVSLDGRRIMPKGAIQGGKGRSSNIFTSQTTINVTDLKAQVEQLNQEEETETKILNEYRQARDKVRENINNFEVSMRACLGARRDFNSKLQELNDDYRLITKTNIEGGVREESAESESLKITREITNLQTQLVEKQQKVNGIIESRTKYAERQASLSNLNQEKHQELEQLKDSTTALRIESTKLNERIKGYEDRLLDKYNLTTAAILAPDYPVVSIEDEEATRARIKQLTTDINALGNINVDAIAEYEVEKERFETSDRERQDVQSSVDNLNQIIQDMDQSMEKQFKEVVDEVNAALPESFAKLFGGGDASLIYTDPNDILNTGIDIKVNPPGKKITNINLLSGGEKSLVALSVLFSILKVRPLPLVILDEAEAPLDPANVERFAKYIKNFTDDTQFIVVTHREGTMENCDVLYGVTMEQKGVTKIVKIKLREARALAEEEQFLSAQS